MSAPAKRIFSGIQPTGNLHLGNYLGAIRNWVGMQKDYDCIFCIVDMHAITVPQDPVLLRQSTREVTAAYIASGIDPDECIIFNQSAVSGHAEIAWILQCHAPMGWLNRMTQFKEKAGKKRDNAMVGLYVYPVLMAADILLYKATDVPVGEDQKQHLELSRDIAGAFNRYYDQDYFPLPEPRIFGAATRVMSLRDGSAKMSKSDPSDLSRITFTDDADSIANKIKRAKTDPEPLPSEAAGLEGRPEADNLVGIYAALADQTVDQVLAEFGGKGFGQFKPALSDVAVSVLSPITSEMKRMLDDLAYVDGVLAKGAARANAIAQPHMAEIKDIVGFLHP
ncbi:MAG: tryptophan--tRNA ligase [Alphaproteobacteria bacterium]